MKDYINGAISLGLATLKRERLILMSNRKTGVDLVFCLALLIFSVGGKCW